MKTKRGKTHKQLVKEELDKVFSIYIRLRDNRVCITCGKQFEMMYAQAGHFVSRKYNSLRWDEYNVNCQCRGCNVMQSGRLDEYAFKLRSKYGEKILDYLQEKKHQTFKPETQWMIEKVNYYREKVIELEAIREAEC